MWILTAEGLLGFLDGGLNEKEVPEREVLTLEQELKRRAAPPMASVPRSWNEFFMVLPDFGL
jgi:hypothetical protein